MKKSLTLATLLIATGTTGFAGDTVELNGITSLFGQKMAFMLLHQQGPAAPVSFYLMEGQSQHGIKLVTVDLANCRVQIERDGQKQYMRLSSAPDLTVTEAPLIPGRHGGIHRITPVEQARLDQFVSTDGAVQKILSGQPIYTGAYIGAPPAGTGSPGSSGNSPGGSENGTSSTSDSSGGTGGTGVNSTQGSNTGANSSSSASQGADASNSTASTDDYTKQYWYWTSRNVELNRIDTATKVLSGEMEPLPRTPLTPANTPPALVGTETFFGSHIPGFPDNSSVNGWGDQGP